jgi:Nif-specific regulatory protein/two-component system response regulator HydG
VDTYAALFEMAKLLLAEDDADRTAELLFRRLLEITEATRGFIVVRSGEDYEDKFDVHFDRTRISGAERRFSRTLVRQVIQSGQTIRSPDLVVDPRFASMESAEAVGGCAVLVAPLPHGGQVHGVVYLERRGRDFPPWTEEFLGAFGEVAALFLLRALERRRLEERSRSLERDLFSQHDFEGIVTQDPAMLDVLKVVAQVADADATVLVRGETGTGKELIARALHVNSRRRKRPFATLHCSALPASVLESELFGHVKGAFTGAERDRPGRIAAAAGGTVFLDEIAEIPPELQAKLLRFLQFGELQRLGSDRPDQVDVRVVAATHQDLAALMAAGRFRQDLYFRLNVLEVTLPPLRARRGDIPLLVDRFLRDRWKRPGPRPTLTAGAERALAAHDYPGNVRELAHIIERACLLATGPTIDLDLLPPELRSGGVGTGSAASRFERYDFDELENARAAATATVEHEFLTGLMKRANGNTSLASRESKISRSYLQRLLTKHGL